MACFPGQDIEAVQRHLREQGISSLWTAPSFVYPLLFETKEALAVSDTIFVGRGALYPGGVIRREPPPDCGVFVIETDSPARPTIVMRLAQAGGTAPLITEHGTLTIIEQSSHR
jgi:hypothetical protein